jgi:hypothetical protein
VCVGGGGGRGSVSRGVGQNLGELSTHEENGMSAGPCGELGRRPALPLTS